MSADLGRGWAEVPMLNNVERLEPHGTDPAGAALAAARNERRLTALDEGRAWRRREGRVLAVLRVEAFADATGGAATAHRTAWQEHGAASLEATWRANWTEREVAPGWIEALVVAPEERPDPLHAFGAAEPAPGAPRDVDWIRIEDHTGEGSDVTLYEHLSVWRGRHLAVLTIRHDLGLDLDGEAAAAAAALHGRLGG